MDVDSMFMFKFAAVEFPLCMILSQSSSKKTTSKSSSLHIPVSLVGTPLSAPLYLLTTWCYVFSLFAYNVASR